MSRGTVSKRVYCKRAAFMQPAQAHTLQSRMAAALLALRTVASRKQVSGDDGNYVRTILYHRSQGDMLFAVMASYERGTHQLMVIDDDDSAEMLSVAQVAPPKAAGNKRQEFLEGTCYLGVMRSHVLLAGSRSLGAGPTEHYLNWLLQQGDALPPNDRLVLSDQIARATRERITASHVREVEIGTAFLQAQPADNSGTATRKGVAAKAFEFSGLGLDLVRQALGPDGVNRLRLADAVDGNIEVSLKVRYKRSTTEKAHKVLDDIGLAARNLDGEDVRLTLVGGGTVTGQQLKLSAALNVQARDGVPDPDDLFPKMRDWLIGQIENRIIDP